MLYLYDTHKKTLTPSKETQFHAHGLLERQDLAKWVESNPSMLGEDLLIITTEYDGFDKTNERLDLLALDTNGNVVVIELKRDDSGKNVDLQALKYAAYCSTLTFDDLVGMYVSYHATAGSNLSTEEGRRTLLEFIENEDFEELNDRPRIILVAREFRPEVTASVLWLRKCDLDITCVKWSPYALPGDCLGLYSSVLIPLPEAKDFVIRVEKKEQLEHTTTITQTEYREFFRDCIELLKKQLPGDYRAPKPTCLYQIPTGIGGVHFEWAFHGRPRSSFGVELHFEKNDRDANQELMAACVNLKDSLESALKERVVVQAEWGRRWSRIYVEKPEGRFMDELKQWAVAKMLVFIQTLQPELDKVK